jgi:peroxiredoxin Q/BCP
MSMASKKRSKKKSAGKAKKKGGKAKAGAKAVRKGKKRAKKAAPAAAGKKARKAKRGKKARATGKSKQTSGAEEPAPMVDAISVESIVGAGSKAPSFSLPDQDGNTVSSRDLAGKPYVLYFYPKDDTPGCTVEACDFRDGSAQFAAAGVRVLGVSPDSPQSHTRFRSKFSLRFPLLADEKRELAKKYGVWVKKQNYGREYMGILRSTFLVDGTGRVQRAWRGVKVPGHVGAVLDEAQRLA